MIFDDFDLNDSEGMGSQMVGSCLEETHTVSCRIMSYHVVVT